MLPKQPAQLLLENSTPEYLTSLLQEDFLILQDSALSPTPTCILLSQCKASLPVIVWLDNIY